jgi:hypothetical protein
MDLLDSKEIKGVTTSLKNAVIQKGLPKRDTV